MWHTRRPSCAAMLASLVLLASPAAAATLFTPPVLLPTGWLVWCTVTNIGTKALENVVVERVNHFGVVSGTSSAASLAPGATIGGGGTAASDFYRCQAPNLSKSKAIVTVCVQQNASAPCSPIAVNR
jgi:hypothetical protein